MTGHLPATGQARPPATHRDTHSHSGWEHPARSDRFAHLSLPRQRYRWQAGLFVKPSPPAYLPGKQMADARYPALTIKSHSHRNTLPVQASGNLAPDLDLDRKTGQIGLAG